MDTPDQQTRLKNRTAPICGRKGLTARSFRRSLPTFLPFQSKTAMFKVAAMWAVAPNQGIHSRSEAGSTYLASLELAISRECA